MKRKVCLLPLSFLLFLPLANAGLLDSILSGGDGAKGKEDEQPVSDDKATKYLQDFGYVAPGQLNLRGMAGDFGDPIKEAVRKFQSFAHLPVTGVLDVRTKKKMAKPRCGMQDVEMLLDGSNPYKWQKSVVTYKIHNFSPDLSSSQQRDAIRRAYQTWAAVIPLRFEETQGQADINVIFASGSHGDPWPFDGKGGVLAHATMPTDGKLHFDESENWVLGPGDADKIATSRYTDLYPVAIHEIGHTLGLSHAKVEDAIMAPFYQETVDESGNYIMPRLKSDDIRAIQAIYGSGRGSSSSGGGWGGSSSVGGGGRGSSGGGRTSGGGSGGRTGGGGSSWGGTDWDWPSSGRGRTGGGSGGSGWGSNWGGGSGGWGGSSGRGSGGWGTGSGSEGRTGGWGGSGGRTSTSDWDWPSSHHGSSSGGGGSGGSSGGSGSSGGRRGGGSLLDSLFDKWLGRR